MACAHLSLAACTTELQDDGRRYMTSSELSPDIDVDHW